jgi:hypothetical protein
MTEAGEPPDTRGRDRRALLLVGTAAVLLVGAAVALGVAAEPAAAQANNSTNSTISDRAGYYNETNVSATGDSWWADLDPAAPLETTVALGQRFPSFVGVGAQDPSGTGFQGALLTALIMVGFGVGAVARTRIGEVGGTILSLVIGYALTDFGLAPVWLKPLLVLPIALLAAIAVIRAIQ